MSKLLISELVAGSTLLIAMLAIWGNPQYHPFAKRVILLQSATGGVAVMAVIAVCAFVVSGG